MQRRGKFEETSRVHIGPERVCGANRLSLSVPMHVWSSDESTTRHHAKSSARGAMRRALGHEARLLRSALTGGCSDDFHDSVSPQGRHSIGVDSALIEIILGYLSCASCQSPRRLGFTVVFVWVSRHLMTNAELDTRLEHLGDSLKAGLLRSPRSILLWRRRRYFPSASSQCAAQPRRFH